MTASGASLIAFAKKFIGVPYVWGGTTPKGFDCSGLVQYVYNHFGIKLPRTSEEQAMVGTKVSNYKQLQMGDLIVSDWGGGWGSHIAMYAGGGKLIEAPRTGVPVRIMNLDSNYRAHVNIYKRVKGVSSAPATVSTASWNIPGLPDFFNLDDIGGLAKTLGKLIEKGGGTISLPLPGGGSIPLPIDEAKKLLEKLTDAGKSVGGDVGDTLGDIFKFPSEIIGFFKDATDALTSMSDFFMAFFRPSTYIRLACGWFGTFFLFVGVFFLIREGKAA